MSRQDSYFNTDQQECSFLFIYVWKIRLELFRMRKTHLDLENHASSHDDESLEANLISSTSVVRWVAGETWGLSDLNVGYCRETNTM